MLLRNVGPGIATELRAEYLATLRPVAAFLPPEEDPSDYPPRTDPKRLTPKHRAYLSPDDEGWIVF